MNPKYKSLFDMFNSIYEEQEYPDRYEGSYVKGEIESAKEMLDIIFKSRMYDFEEEFEEDFEEEDVEDEIYEIEDLEGKTIENLLDEGKSFREIQRMYKKNRF